MRYLAVRAGTPKHGFESRWGYQNHSYYYKGFRDTFRLRATTEPFSFLADEPPEGVRRVGVSVRVYVQITLGRDSDRVMAETLTHNLEDDARLSAEAGVRVAQPVQQV